MGCPHVHIRMRTRSSDARGQYPNRLRTTIPCCHMGTAYHWLTKESRPSGIEYWVQWYRPESSSLTEL